MSDSDVMVSYGIHDIEFHPSSSLRHHIIFCFSVEYEYMKWLGDQDQDTLCLVQQDEWRKLKRMVFVTFERLSFEEITEPVKKLLEPLWLQRGAIEKLIDFVWTTVLGIESELATGNKIVDIDIDVFIQHHYFYHGKCDCLISDGSCSICLGDLSDELLGLRCSHVLHQDCITKWLERSDSCPLCRRDTPLQLHQYLKTMSGS